MVHEANNERIVPQRQSLVDTAVGLDDVGAMSAAIAGLGASVAHLSEDQRGRLVAAAIDFRLDGTKAHAIAVLGAGLAHLSEGAYARA